MRPFVEIAAEQRSPAWFAARAGRLTGSRASDVLSKIKTGEAAARRDYRLQMVTERLTGQPQEDGFINAAMQRGIDMEPAAFAAYEAHSGNIVRRTGFLSHTSLMVGCSLDGDIDDYDGILELKCPKSATHLRYLRSGGALPAEHVAQVTHNLWVTGAKYCNFASFDDRYPTHLQLWVVRITAESLDIAAYAGEATKFLSEVDVELAAIQALRSAA